MEFNPRRYAIYTRQSVESSEKSLSSCDVQFSICQDFMQSRAGPLCQWIGERLDDDGHSGATLKRPSVKRLMALVTSGLVDDVVIYRLDRLTRSLRDSVVIFEAFQKAGVELLIVTAPELASSASDRLVLNLMGVFAEFERDMIRSRLADTRANLRRHGHRLAGKLPYGYDADPTTKQLIVNRLEAKHVRHFFKMVADGTLPTEIAAIANQRGWRTKVTVAKRSGRKSGGGFWTPRQILDLLSNPVYLGVFADGNATRPGTHHPIISAEEFESRRGAHTEAAHNEIRPHNYQEPLAAPREDSLPGVRTPDEPTCHQEKERPLSPLPLPILLQRQTSLQRVGVSCQRNRIEGSRCDRKNGISCMPVRFNES